MAAANPTLAEAFQQAGYRRQATVASFVLNRQFGLAQGFEVYHDVVADATGDPLHAERKGDDICEDALAMLRALARERFFLWVHFFDPHYPYESPHHPDILSPEAYEDEITFMDGQIGRLLDELRRLDLERETLVVVVGDHGEDLDQHDELTHGYFLYETVLHVPLIFRCPGAIPGGQSIATPVRTIDIAPTVLDLLGRPAWDQAQGVSLSALLQGGDQDLELPAYSETLEANVQFGLSRLRSLRAGEWKYILAPESELYHVVDDPGETRNRLADQPETGADLREQLRTLIAEAPLPPAEAGPAATLTASEIARLESLGYVAAGTPVADEGLTELDRFEPQGGNPVDYAELFKLNCLARKAVRTHDYELAERILRQIIAAIPEAPLPHAGLAEVLRRQGRLDEAIETYEQALANAPKDTYIRQEYAVALSAAGRRHEAISEFRTVLREAPDNTVVLYNMGATLALLGRLEQADKHFQSGLKIQPRNARLLYGLGVLRFRQNRLEEAKEYMHKALAIDPDFRQCREDLQRLQRAMGG